MTEEEKAATLLATQFYVVNVRTACGQYWMPCRSFYLCYPNALENARKEANLERRLSKRETRIMFYNGIEYTEIE